MNSNIYWQKLYQLQMYGMLQMTGLDQVPASTTLSVPIQTLLWTMEQWLLLMDKYVKDVSWLCLKRCKFIPEIPEMIHHLN